MIITKLASIISLSLSVRKGGHSDTGTCVNPYRTNTAYATIIALSSASHMLLVSIHYCKQDCQFSNDNIQNDLLQCQLMLGGFKGAGHAIGVLPSLSENVTRVLPSL